MQATMSGLLGVNAGQTTLANVIDRRSFGASVFEFVQDKCGSQAESQAFLCGKLTPR